MDPNATLHYMRQLSEAIQAAVDSGEPIDDGDATGLADMVQAMDGWLSSGGFLPKGWVYKD